MDIVPLIEEVQTQAAELTLAFEEIQQPRSDFQLAHFVVGQHDTSERAYLQCVLELQAKHDGIKRAMFKRERLVEGLEAARGEAASITCRELQFELEVLDRTLLGMAREFRTLHAIWQAMPRYGYEQIQAAEARYWQLRLARQAAQDIAATGRVGVGNQEAIAQAGWEVRRLVEAGAPVCPGLMGR